MNFIKQILAQLNAELLSFMRFGNVVEKRTVISVFAMLVFAFSANAQHDVALDKTVDMDSVAIGDVVTFSIKVSNQNSTNVAGLQVRDTLTPGLFYLDHIAPAGTTYETLTGVWMVNDALNASTDELTLTIRAQVLSEGMFMNIAEVIDMSGTDVDSEPDNEELLEDDMDKACVSVPVTICSELGDMVRVTLLPMFTDIQWYRDGDLIPANQGGTQDTFYISDAGIYSFTALESGCPTRTCCPVVVKDSCFDLSLKKTLAATQDDVISVGSEVDYVLEITNQGDLVANTFSVLDDVDLSFFAPFDVNLNANGNTGGDVALPYTWANSGNDGQVTITGAFLPGQTITIPVTLTVLYPGQADNYAEIFSDDNRDRDSQPESQELDENGDTLVDNEIDNNGGDEDDHDVESVTVLAAALGDYVWYDDDRDGQQDSTETGVPDVIVYLYDADDNLIGTDTTDADGLYLFDNLPPDDYYVVFDINTLPDNYNPTASNNGDDTSDSDGDSTGRTQTVTLAMGETNLDIDFGIEPDFASVGDFVWVDEDMDGQQDNGEDGVPGVIVYLNDANGNLIATDTTDSNGAYLFDELDPGDYFIVFDVGTLPNGFGSTVANNGDDASDSDGNASGMTGTFSLTPGEHNPTIDFGIAEGCHPPFLVNSPFDSVTIECGATIPFEPPIFNDLCDDNLDVSLDSMISDVMCNEVIVRTWTAVNDSGESVTFTQTVTQIDTSPPVLFANHSFFGEIKHGDTIYADCTQIASLDSIGFSAVDACCDDVERTFEETFENGHCENDGYIRIMYCGWTATDCCNNSDSLYFNVVISDNVPPVITGVPADTTIGCADLPYPPSSNVIGVDACDPAPIVNMSETIIGDVQTGSYQINRNWVAIDSCGNTSNTEQVVTVQCDQSFDLALDKVLAPNQGNMVDIGDEVSYFIKVTNEGAITAYDIQIVDLIPDGLVFSPNNSAVWTLISSDSAEFTLPGPLAFGETDSVEIKMIVQYGSSGASIVNVAEIEGARDENNIVVQDVDSTPNNGNPLEDDIDEEKVELLNHDPTGWVYCDKTGQIITGGTITVVGPNGIPNDEVAIISDGSNGFYEFYAIGSPGIYTLSYNGLYPISPNCTDSAGPFDPTGLPTPIVLGQDTINSMYLADIDCAVNPYYLTFDLENGDPPILLNNIPVQCSFIGAIVCEDTNNNEMPDPADMPIPGVTVYLYDCADTNTPIDSVVSNALGEYSFDGLQPGEYIVGVDATNLNIVTNGPINPNGLSDCIVLDWGDCDSTTNICFAQCPVVDAGDDIEHCNPSESTQLNATVPFGAGSFSWSPTNGLNNVNIANPTASPAVTTTYTITYSDGSGCIDTDQITVTVGCSQPYLTYEPFDSMTVSCSDTEYPFDSPIFTDDCDNNLMITLDSITVPVQCGWMRTRTWRVVNGCGNDLVFEQVITATDNNPPLVVEPADITVTCENIPDPVTPVFTDDCDTDLDIEYFEFIEDNGCGDQEIKRIWEATDDCGHETTVEQIITVNGSGTPEIVFNHPWLAGLTDGDTLVMECDNTDLFSEIDAEVVGSCCDASISFVENGITPGNCATDGYIVIMHCTWIATDDNGNSTSLTLHMRIEDNNPPVFSNVPADITVACGEPVPPCVAPDVIDACSNPTVSSSTNDVPTADGFDRTCSWTATDECGNVSTASYTIHVLEDPGPIITGVPDDLTVNLTNGETVPAFGTISAVDGCTGLPLPIGTFEMTSPPTGCQYTITRTWTITATGGNLITETQTITVIDGISFTLDSTTPDTCGLANGSATFSPNTYVYTWSDGGTGAFRDDLVEGIYSVTVANGTCNEVTQVTITETCGCQMPVLESLDLTSAGCGSFDGTATINLVGDESMYDYLWVPNLGVPNVDGNGRTGLPAQRYVVFATFQGQVDCVEKFEFEITDDCFDCPDVIEVNAMIANTSNLPATVCVAVPFGVSSERDLSLNNTPYTGSIAACNEETVFGYSYANLVGNGTIGRYSVAWRRGAKSFYTVVDNMDQLAAKMRQIDPNGKWMNIPASQRLVTTNLMSSSGDLEILHVPTESLHVSSMKQTKEALGTEFIIPEGLNELVVDGLDVGCSDTIAVTVNIIQIGTDDPTELDNETTSKIDPVESLTLLQNDTLRTRSGEPVTADLMVNDFIDGDYSCFEIVRQPDNGYVTVDENYAVTYLPFNEFCNTDNEEPMDKFFYEICMDNGKRYTAVAYVEIECAGDVKLYPNPADRFVNLDLSPFAGQTVGVKIFNDLGVCVETVWVGEAITTPVVIDMDVYRAGHYTFWIQPETGRAKVVQLIKVRQ